MKNLNTKIKEPVKHGGEVVLVWEFISTFVTGDLAFIDNIIGKNMILNILKYKLLKEGKKNGNLIYIQILSKYQSQSTNCKRIFNS